ncbi:error-prone DNA polymerase [Lysobacter sp. BMK333-48F3]|uniref:error-prone DNA polymerase n=1 Tax=Lysobacter sp. BMK333-48F3 TaxID=2867962 RepID=UPI001C8BEEA5|nr:error-prone DNA polymerase [Lysobacter sp. BMK333-48F3]MBX9402985.1 error-prone DNA polymerase [Lysobacter sp. BMK333-48F3]
MNAPFAANDRAGAADPLPDYAELHCLSAFSFQRGASVAQELFERARDLGYRALAITDECTLAGIVRAWQAARDTGVALIVGSEIRVHGGPKLVLLVERDAGYASLCGLITLARRRAGKGEYRSLGEDFDGRCDGLLALWLPDGDERDAAHAAWLRQRFGGRLWVAVGLHRGADDDARLAALRDLAARHGLPCVAAGDVHMHERGRRALQDVMTAIRHRCTVAEAGRRLFPNGERHLRIRKALAAIYPRELLDETLRIAERCRFDLKQGLDYQYPHELVPAGETPKSWLPKLVARSALRRWPQGVPEDSQRQIAHELGIIEKLEYESYFLTVHDIVEFARREKILCQGRGSAANSIVCYALGITEIDPTRMGMLFERFMSVERNEPPDIDVDFEHQRREEVLQYVFERYGRERAALTAVAISYRGRSAVRNIAAALGMPQDQIGELARTLDRWSEDVPLPEHLRERGFDPDSPLLRKVVGLSALLVDGGFPRHLSQHPGGFVISERPLHTLVPVENAAMDGRTVVQWDKDDLDAMGLLKVDCLALGMLTAIRKTLATLKAQGVGELSMSSINAGGDDPAVYGMICEADTIGVFQIESRAQMSMLPRLRPRCFYDLVIEIAIVRPGPIQGDMVNPYLQRRKHPELVEYPSDALREVLKRTLGVPLFQEQVMQIAIVAAGYLPGEADQLRRSMAAWKRHGGLEPHREKLRAGMLKRGYSEDFAHRIFEQIKGFGSYGFPESHAASFALIAYVSCWLKHYHPAAFACGVINSAPMGFYTHGQILHDARRHGVTVLPVDVRYSDWDCTLEALPGRSGGKHPHAIRMGLRLISGFDEASAERISDARAQAPWRDVDDLCARAALDARVRALLADSGALRALAGHRHRARWAVAGVDTQLPLFAGVARDEAPVALPLPSAGEDVRADYALLGTTLGRHPLSLLRSALHARRCRRSSQLAQAANGSRVRFAGLVTVRQHPETSAGVTFLSLEDEDGTVNAVVWRDLAQRQRRVLVEARLMAIDARLERVDGVQHLIVSRMEDLTALLGNLSTHSRDFH